MKIDKPKPKREPKRRSPAVREERDDLDFEIPDPSIPQPYQVPGLSHPPMQLRTTA
jgi:hypothetical protein